jgi:hypothetical protein
MWVANQQKSTLFPNDTELCREWMRRPLLSFVRHSREGGNLQIVDGAKMDSRLRGNDGVLRGYAQR